MSEAITSNKRLAKNTFMLYVRMGLTLLVGLYTSRIVLDALGIVDYGLFNVVGGVIGMLGFLNMALSSSTQRFLNFNEQHATPNQLRIIFSNAVNLHILIALVVVILLETVGLWFVYNKVVIPPSQFNAALILFHISVASCFLSIITTPYSAAINAHERMGVYAYFSIIDVLLRLLIVYLLTVFKDNRLIIYGALCLGVSLIMQVIYNIYCYKKFPECRYKFNFNKKLIKEMFYFSGWMVWGCFSVILSNQGITIIINLFCGPVYNASRGIASSVQSIIQQFSGNILVASKPQITKSYTSPDRNKLQNLVSITTRSTFLMLLIPAVPLLLYTQEILELWLKEVPPMTNIFVRLLIIDILIRSLFEPIGIVNQSGGKVKWYQIIITAFYILQFVLGYLFLKIGLPPYSPYIAIIICNVMGIWPRLLIVSKIDSFETKMFCKKSIIPIIRVLVIITIISLIYYTYIIRYTEGIGMLFINCVVLIAITSLLSYYLGLNKEERENIKYALISRLKRKSYD